ncbi:MAG: hypothetical protein NT159_05875 [Proteobacteria bacterium]|nr:hypothetical protein [Pseudomonadota bacterium]
MTTRETSSASSVVDDIPKVEVGNPKLEGKTLADTLSYATQNDADPAQVLYEIVSLITPFCAHRSTLGNLRLLIHEAGTIVGNEQGNLAAEDATSTFEEIDMFDYADAFNKIEALAERLVMQVPRELCDIAFSIKTIAKSFGSEMQGMSEFYTAVPTVVQIRKGGAA